MTRIFEDQIKIEKFQFKTQQNLPENLLKLPWLIQNSSFQTFRLPIPFQITNNIKM